MESTAANIELTDVQTDAIFNYIYARTRRYAHIKQGAFIVGMAATAYFVMRSLIDSPGMTVPAWIAPALALAGVVIVLVGLSATLIADFEKYPVRELSKRFESPANGH
jgi:hypothetical protein